MCVCKMKIKVLSALINLLPFRGRRADVSTVLVGSGRISLNVVAYACEYSIGISPSTQKCGLVSVDPPCSVPGACWLLYRGGREASG